MLIIIDGHNLIPKIPGLSLRDIDDEESLIELLKEFTRVKRKDVVVFFDGAPPGQAGERVYGALRAYFVPARRTADDAILQYLKVMGKAARHATVVSSDRMVQANARALYAKVLPSEEFARQLTALRAGQAANPPRPRGKPSQPKDAGAPAVGAAEIDQWIDLFGLDPAQAEAPIDLSKKPKKPASQRQPGPAQEKPRRRHGFPKKPA